MPSWVAVLAVMVMLSACHSGTGGNLARHPSPDADSSLIALYRGPLNHLNAVRYGSCPMHPTCSEYARQAVAAYGPVKGWILAMDRLMRCGRDETAHAPIVQIGGEPKFYDPLTLQR